MTNYFIIKMYPIISQPQLEFLTGGWMPVSQIIGGEATVCIFTTRSRAEDYKSSYSQISTGQFKSLEINSMSVEDIRKFKLISDKLTSVAIDPSLDYTQFNVNNVKLIDELVS